jgi:Dual specificity phosphatase, catalytic domain
VIAHLMKTKKIPLADALKHVKERRRIVKPNTGFIAQLRQWEEIVERNSFSIDASPFIRKSVAALRKERESKSPIRHINSTLDRGSKGPSIAQSPHFVASVSPTSTGGEKDIVVVIRTLRYSCLELAQ